MTAAIRLDDEGAIYVDDDVVATDSRLTPRDLFRDLRTAVLGQDRALRTFCVAAWRHAMGLRQGALLITGPTGSGKTLLVKAYARRCALPYIHVNSTGLVAEGIKGLSLGEVFLSILQIAQRDYSLARKCVIVIDEVDKICSNLYASSIETSLLAILDGTPWRSFDNDKKPSLPGGCFETDRLLVVLIGSFTSVRQQRGERVGFDTDQTSSLPDIPLDELVPLPDLRGRIATHVQVAPHSRRSLLAILNASDGPMQTLRDSIPQWHVFLCDEMKDRLVEETLVAGLGARYLWTRVAALSEELVFDPPTKAGTYGGFVVQPRAA